VPRSIPAGLAYFDYDNDGSMDLSVVNNSQPNALYLNKGNGVFQDVTTGAGLNSAGNQVTGSDRLFLNNSARLWLRGSVGTTENFMRIGHSLVALIVALLGGQLSCYLHSRNLGRTSGLSSQENRPEPTEHLSGPSQ
jgi:FG-GAP-like repeat